MTHGEDFISALSPKLEVTGCAYGTFFFLVCPEWKFYCKILTRRSIDLCVPRAMGMAELSGKRVFLVITLASLLDPLESC